MALGGANAPHLRALRLSTLTGIGGFRFAGRDIAARCCAFRTGIWAWPVNGVAELNADTLSAAFKRAEVSDFFLIGTGREPWVLPAHLRDRFVYCRYPLMKWRQAQQCELTIFFWRKNRRVGAGLIAVA